MSEANLSLFTIEQALADLVVARDEVTEPDEIQAVEAALREYVEREVQKADGIRAYLRHCDLMAAAARDEEQRQIEHRRAWEARRDRLKQAVAEIMDEKGLKRIEGKTGSLLLKGNGGKAPLSIDVEGMIPAEYWSYRLEVDGAAWQEIKSVVEMFCPGVQPQSAPDSMRIRKALEAGEGVPGAHLDERGKHLEVK